MIWTVLAIVFIASFVRSALGFGGALVAMPLLSMLYGLQFATPLVGLMSITCAFLILRNEWRNINFEAVKKFFISIIIGIPIGIWLIKLDIENLLKVGLGIILIVFALWRIFDFIRFHFKDDRYASVFGFIAGVLGGAYNVNGPAVVIYGVMREWEPSTFKGTLQGIFLPMSIMIIGSHCIGGLWTKEVLLSFAYTIPVIIVAVFLGKFVSDKIDKNLFSRLVYLFLILIGVTLIYRNLPLLF